MILAHLAERHGCTIKDIVTVRDYLDRIGRASVSPSKSARLLFAAELLTSLIEDAALKGGSDE